MSTPKPVRKAVIPVAGYGTRFLPYTKSIPKEMLPIVDRPVIHIIAEEIAAAGIQQIIMVTGTNKRALEDYFDYNLELETTLIKAGKEKQLAISREASDLASFVYVRQREQLGNGHAVLQAKDLIADDEPFLMTWGDEVFMGQPSKVQQLVDTWNRYGVPVIQTRTIETEEDFSRYGVIVPGERLAEDIWEVKGFVEKPGKAAAPSNLANLGCMILTGDVFRYLETQQPGHGGEIVLGEAMNRYAADGNRVITKEVSNLQYFDCGNKLEYMKATLEFALQREDIGEELAAYIKHRADDL